MSFCQGTKHNSWLFPSCYGNRSMLSSHDLREYGIQVCPAPLKYEMLPEIHKMEKYDFLKSMIHSQII